MVRVSILEELAKDEGLVKSFALVLDRWDEGFRVDRCVIASMSYSSAIYYLSYLGSVVPSCKGSLPCIDTKFSSLRERSKSVVHRDRTGVGKC